MSTKIKDFKSICRNFNCIITWNDFIIYMLNHLINLTNYAHYVNAVLNFNIFL